MKTDINSFKLYVSPKFKKKMTDILNKIIILNILHEINVELLSFETCCSA